jgi:hypothetical protein
MSEIQIIKNLTEALTAAEAHLEYCGYGDSWERECAKSEKLSEQITKALEQSNNYLKEKSK